MEKMRILHISRTMGQGGAEKVVYQLCKGNNHVEQFVSSCGGRYVEELKKVGVEHIVIPDIDKKSPMLVLRTLLVLLKTVKDKRITIVHSHHRMAAFYARLLQIINHRLKHVYTDHNVFYDKKTLMRFSLKKASIVACGETVKKNLIEDYSIAPEKIQIIYNSIEKTPIKNIHIDSLVEKRKLGYYLVGCIGRISEQKGIDVFVKAIAQCKKAIPNIVGVIIGDGEDRQKIEQIVRTIGISDSVIFLGYQKDVLSIISNMEFIVLCSRWEGFPLTPIETFSVGKTIIVTDIPNNIEIVKDGINGLTFRKDDVDDLAKKIIELKKNAVLKKHLEEKASDDYVKRFSYVQFLEAYQKTWNKQMQ